MRLEDLLKKLKEHKPIVVNYGKGFDGEDIKERAEWDEDKNAYVGETGTWDTKLLIEIAQGKVVSATLELEE